MKPSNRPIPLTWHVRLRMGGTPRPDRERSAVPFAASRPGIAGRWKPRDRVSAAGT
jgi:hypothetical protein